MGPLRGDGNVLLHLSQRESFSSREDGSPSWGRKPFYLLCKFLLLVEKMGPLRGDGNLSFPRFVQNSTVVEKMGPLRGDGN